MQQDDELLNDFLQESRDHLTSIESDLLAMEEAGADADEQLVNKVFRAAHSIKGGAGFFNMVRVQKLAHRLENALDLVRGREMVPTPEVVNILLLGFDRLRDMINQPAASETVEIEDLVVALTGLTTSHLPEAEKLTLGRAVPLPGVPGQARLVELTEFDWKRASKSGRKIYLMAFDLLHDVHRRGKSPWSIFKELMDCGTILDCAWDLDTVGTLDDDPTNAIPFQVLYATVLEGSLVSALVDIPAERIVAVPMEKQAPRLPAAPAPSVPAAAPAASPVAAPAPGPAPAPVAAPAPGPVAAARVPAPTPEPPAVRAPAEAAGGETTLRVSLAVLEQLMNLAGEMVLGRNQLMEAISTQDTRAIQAGAQRINLVTSELQEAIMLTRMQPIGNVLNRFPRVVRDLSKELGKEIQLIISGREVEIDRTILEGLADPLTHMVRNAVDHGIETPGARETAGKLPTGTIDLRVFHEAGVVNVEIRDDGKGLDVPLIAAKAVEKGLVTKEQVRAMSAKEQTALIFLPGLSTADRVSSLSGRGVGMDVVRTNPEKLTLAIVPSLLVSVGGERFAVPQVNVAELIRIPPEQIQERIEVVGETEVLLLRGQLIPLVRLAEVLGIGSTYLEPGTKARLASRRTRLSDRRGRRTDAQGTGAVPKPRQGPDRRFHDTSALNVVVVNAGVLQYGIQVEALHDTVEIVVKPLGRHMKAFREYAGATILGDGGVALIVDVVSLAGLLGMTSQGGTARAAELAAEQHQDRFRDRHAFLTFHNAPEEACVVPLEQVARVERVERDRIERIGGRVTMQYRGGSLPLVSLQEAAGLCAFTEDQELVVIVFAMDGREVGLLGALPVDSVEVEAPVDQETHRANGIAGSMIIRDRTTLVVDIHEVVARLLPDARPAPSAAASAAAGSRVVLLAEDSDFFRNQMRKFLEGDGYTVIPAEDGEIAWERLQEHKGEVQAVVTDIEMPRLNGFDLVQRIRSSPAFAHLPVIAVTSLAGEDDILRGKAVGFSDYQIKLDRERLTESLRGLLANLRPAPLAASGR
jgi:two-component system, chemotaxis family, sensor kinase CheA